MTRYWTCHWRNRYWRDEVNRAHEPISIAGGNSFRKRGVSIGDVIYIVSLAAGQLLLGGRMAVTRIMSRSEAIRILNIDTLYDADEWAIGNDESGTPLNLRRRLAPEVSRHLRFGVAGSEPKGLSFVSATDLDGQTTRGVRELVPESAALLDLIIELTDRLPRSDKLITVTEEFFQNGSALGRQDNARIPEEIPVGSTYGEGAVERILVNRYERNPRAREECIRYYGAICFLCGFDFEAVFGEIMTGFIHVHHLSLLSNLGTDYEIDPIRDLRPVCPNCHAALHRRNPPYSPEELRLVMRPKRTAP